MIKDKQNQLGLPSLNYPREIMLDTDLAKLEYAQKEIIKNWDKYFLAKERYERFQENEKRIFDLYVGQGVKDKPAHFEAVIHNVYIPGMIFGNADIIESNMVDNARRNLILFLCEVFLEFI